jgi:hypothetical protein
MGNLLMRTHYSPNAAPQLHLVFRADKGRPHGDNKGTRPDSQLFATLPVQLDGLDTALRLINLNASYTVVVNGEHYTSPWRPVALSSEGMSLIVPQTLLQHAADAPAHLQLTLAGTVLHPAETLTADMSDHFQVAGNGTCNNIDEPGNYFRCAFAFDVRHPIRIEPVVPADCRTGTLEAATVRTEDAGTTFDPVRFEVMSFRGGNGTECRVRSLRSTVYRPAKNFSTTLDLPAINLNNYVDR